MYRGNHDSPLRDLRIELFGHRCSEWKVLVRCVSIFSSGEYY